MGRGKTVSRRVVAGRAKVRKLGRKPARREGGGMVVAMCCSCLWGLVQLDTVGEAVGERLLKFYKWDDTRQDFYRRITCDKDIQ